MSKRTYIFFIFLVSLSIVAILLEQHHTPSISSEQPSIAVATTTNATSTPHAPSSTPPVAASPAPKHPTTPQPESQPLPTDVVIPVTADETALQAMQQYASSSATFTYTGEDYPSLGFFVESIDGRQNGNGFYWILYINDTSSALGASSAKVAPGDKVEWRYKVGD